MVDLRGIAIAVFELLIVIVGRDILGSIGQSEELLQ